MDKKEQLYNFYDQVLNNLVINTRGLTKRNKRRGYYISQFNFKNKEKLLLVEIIKIVNMFDTKENSLPILIRYNNLKSFINYLRLKFRLRESSLKIRRATDKDINFDLEENLEFVRKKLNFPRTVYEEIYDAFYKKGAKIDA